MSDVDEQRRLELRAERRLVADHRGGIAVRLLATWLFFIGVWIGIVVAAAGGDMPLWLGGLLSFAVATTFYMPLHEATHGNVWGDVSTARWGEDLVGTISAVWVGFSYKGHRISHMKHHAHTNDPERDPDWAIQGPLRDLPIKLYGAVLVLTLLPLFGLVPASRRLLPAAVRTAIEQERLPAEDWLEFRFWMLRAAVLGAGFGVGFGTEVLVLWFVPTMLVPGWLGLVFAWYPHHPAAGRQGRYVDTRVAVFPGSTIIIRGHDHHALHHLFPRVVHYKLPGLWREIGPQLTAKGVRTEGRALGATGPVVWRDQAD